MKEKKKLAEHELLFLVSFFIGIVFITLLAKGKKPENTILNQNLSLTFLEQGFYGRELFLQCLFSRGMVLVLLILLSYTSMRKLSFRIVTVWMGVGLGSLCKLFFLWYGLKGVGLLCILLMPHFLLYWMAYGMLYWELEKRRLRMTNNPVGIFLSTGVVIIGILVESYVNPFLLRAYLNLFF